MQRYGFANCVTEGHKHPVYCVSFNGTEQHQHIFAAVGGTQVTVYHCQAGGTVQVLQVYKVPTAEEELYVCCWSTAADGTPVLAVAGCTGLLRVLDCHRSQLLCVCEGHGGAVNDLAVHPLQPEVILSASRDTSLRLWNWRTRQCLAIVHGDGGHHAEALSVDFHPTDSHRFVSSGMDNSIKIWSTEDVQHELKGVHATAQACPVRLTWPTFSTQRVHEGIVDCVRWLGDLLLSKSTDNRILMWRPDDSDSRALARGEIQLLREFPLFDTEGIWYLRFAVGLGGTPLACGTHQGGLLVFDPWQPACTPVQHLQCGTRGIQHAVRKAAVSRDGSILLACCDDFTIWRFDAIGQ